MPFQKPKQFTAWSFSRLHDYRTCPAKAKYKHLDKLPEPPNNAMARGTDIHKLAEDYAMNRLKRVPEELKLFKEEFKLARENVSPFKAAELEWAFTSAWQSCDWKDWNRAWVRVKIDLIYEYEPLALRVVDHKTGKMRGEHEEQLDLYAVAAFKAKPEIEKVEAALWYLDEGQETKKSYTRADEAKLVKFWDRETRGMMRDTVFKPKPNNLCKWCSYSAAKGGPCKF